MALWLQPAPPSEAIPAPNLPPPRPQRLPNELSPRVVPAPPPLIRAVDGRHARRLHVEQTACLGLELSCGLAGDSEVDNGVPRLLGLTAVASNASPFRTWAQARLLPHKLMQLLGSPTVVLDCLRRCGLLRSVCVPILALVTGHKLAERAVIARSQEQYAVRRVSRGPQELRWLRRCARL